MSKYMCLTYFGRLPIVTLFVFSIWVFFHKHSRITKLQGKWEGIFLTPHCYFHPLHRHLDISWTITPDSSPMHIASSRTHSRTQQGTFAFQAQVANLEINAV